MSATDNFEEKLMLIQPTLIQLKPTPLFRLAKSLRGHQKLII